MIDLVTEPQTTKNPEIKETVGLYRSFIDFYYNKNKNVIHLYEDVYCLQMFKWSMYLQKKSLRCLCTSCRK